SDPAAAAALLCGGSFLPSAFRFRKPGFRLAASDGVIKVFSDVRVRKSSTPEGAKERKK
ncbi:Hypothetical predicted protein, partial [Marmota monax]